MESLKKKKKRGRMETCVQQEVVGQAVQNKEELMVSKKLMRNRIQMRKTQSRCHLREINDSNIRQQKKL